jgi:hypothetical protein
MIVDSTGLYIEKKVEMKPARMTSRERIDALLAGRALDMLNIKIWVDGSNVEIIRTDLFPQRILFLNLMIK